MRTLTPSAPVRTDTSLLAVTTLLLWLGVLAVGSAGFLLHYPHPVAPIPERAPVQAEVLSVQLTDDPLPPPDATPPAPSASEPPPLSTPPRPLSAPPLVAVAEPNPAIAFAVPVEGPVGIVPAKEATSPRPVVKAVEAAPSVQPLTYGSGDGRQPSPTYPFAAQRQGQEGRVIVQFDVGEDGRVLDAAAIRPSPWPLLNAEAVRVIRERWRFRAGPLRRYEVSINFELRK